MFCVNFLKPLAVIITAAVIFTVDIIICYADETAPAITEEDIAGYSSLRNPAYPSEMRAVCLTPSVDFLCGKADGSGYTEAEVIFEINAVLDRAAAVSMNTVIFYTSSGGSVFYGTDSGAARTITDYIAEISLSRGFYLYLVFDINTALSGMKDIPLDKKIDSLGDLVKNITLRYSADGIILDGYYGENSVSAFSEYMEFGSGIGYEQWIYEKNAYIFGTAADAVRSASNTASVGIAVEYVWANASDMTGGSETFSDFQSLFDGYADNYSYVRNGKADFILLKTEEGISAESIPFKNICSWWNDAASSADIRLYVLHDNRYVCSGQNGWDYPDELVKQVVFARKLSNYKGSAFVSLRGLEENKEQSTDVLLKAYGGGLDEQGLGSGLEMTLPEQTEYRTEEKSVIFAGSFDPNFTVYFQGQPVQLNNAGQFCFKMELNVGENVFTFENKGKKITYYITRTVRILRDAAPKGEDIKGDGGMKLSLAAIAYKDSTVSAAIGDDYITLTPADGLTEGIDPNSDYTVYRGSYVLPEGGKTVTDLGNVKIYAAYVINGKKIMECITGSRIYVNIAPQVNTERVSDIQTAPVVSGGEDGTFFGGGNSTANGRRVEIIGDNTMVWSSKNTDTEPVPEFSRLPAGTADMLDDIVFYGGTSYYTTLTGRRIAGKDARLTEGELSADNTAELKNAYISKGNTMLVFELSDKVPFEVSYGGMSYRNGNNGSYYVDDFSPDRIIIDFDYVSDIIDSGTPMPSDKNCLFSGYTYGTGGGKARFELKLSKKGAYDGFKSHYDGNTLILSFNGAESSLSGMTIVIDPGHGYVGNGKFDPGAVQHIQEQSANLAIAKKLQGKLSAAGANVIRLGTENTDYVTAQRAEYSRRYDPDMYIAVHCNSGSSTATGGEAYYFTPFSQPLAAAISYRLGQALSAIHGDGGNYNRGEKYNYFYVTQQQEFPSVLAECAFVSNYEEAMALADDGCQDLFAEAVFRGIEDYIGRR